MNNKKINNDIDKTIKFWQQNVNEDLKEKKAKNIKHIICLIICILLFLIGITLSIVNKTNNFVSIFLFIFSLLFAIVANNNILNSEEKLKLLADSNNLKWSKELKENERNK